MRSEGNIWTELWEQARIVPARRQRRLFDDTKEAEKVMSYLTGLSPGDVASLLHPVLLQAAHLRLLEAGLTTRAQDYSRVLGQYVTTTVASAASVEQSTFPGWVNNTLYLAEKLKYLVRMI